MKCKFCDPENKLHLFVRETDNTITILSNPYLIDDHLLVIPKTHVERPSELSKKIFYELIDEVINVQDMLMLRLNCPGVDIRQNFRPFLPESKLKVNHLHFHVIPRYLEDELYKKSMIYEKNIFKDLSPQVLNRIMLRLKK